MLHRFALKSYGNRYDCPHTGGQTCEMGPRRLSSLLSGLSSCLYHYDMAASEQLQLFTSSIDDWSKGDFSTFADKFTEVRDGGFEHISL